MSGQQRDEAVELRRQIADVNRQIAEADAQIAEYKRRSAVLVGVMAELNRQYSQETGRLLFWQRACLALLPALRERLSVDD